MKKIKKMPYLWFILPGLILYIVFMMAPMLTSFYLSLFSWNGIGSMKFISFDNYIKLFTESRSFDMFTNALGNNIKYVLCMLIIIMPIQLLLAYAFHMKIKGYRTLQLLVFLPFVFSTVIVGFFVMELFNPNFGIINTVLKNLNLEQLITSWLGDRNKAFPIFVAVAGWQGLGVGMMLFLSNMKSIPMDIMEASEIDGAGAFSKFFSVVIPCIIPSIINVLVLDVIWGLTVFDLPYVIVGPNGGVNGSLDFMNLFFYRNAFGTGYSGEAQVGFASAIGTVLFVVILAISIFQTNFLNKIDLES